MGTNQLGDALRLWRDRTRPEAVGIPVGARRRAPGLRREEVAQLAGLSGDYLVRLEQGRARHPSVQVVQALARALRLDGEERDQLYRLAGHLPPRSGQMDRHITPSVQRIVDRLGQTPVVVTDAAWDTVLQNPAADALFGPRASMEGRESNAAWRTFVEVPGSNEFAPQTRSMVETDVVADLHAALIRLPEDRELASLIEDLRRESPRFAELWETTPPRVRGGQTKTLRHPVAGWMTLSCDVLAVHATDLQVVVFTAEPGTPDADALALAIVVGLQDLSV